MILEVCANSYQSAKNAQEAGAHRIELCTELSIGGITPSYGLLKQVAKRLTIETFVLVRPRGGDFTYSDAEFEQMKQDIELCKELGFAGIVSGVLHKDNTIDMERTGELVKVSKPLAFTFHRAFDCTPDPRKALQELVDLHIDRVLTSGQATTAEEGIDLLNELHKLSNDKIIILAGSGIAAHNALKFKTIGLEEIHASASRKKELIQNRFSESYKLSYSDIDRIKGILKLIS